jgi:hypothetical protein
VSDAARRHHYLFAHRALPGTVLRHGADLVAAVRDGRLALDGFWDQVGQTLPEDERLPSAGLAVSDHHIDDSDVLLVTFPVPVGPPEAHFAAIALSTHDGRVRYITLERGLIPADGTRYTVLCEWTGEHHVNLGAGPEPEPDAFLSALRPILARSAQGDGG